MKVFLSGVVYGQPPKQLQAMVDAERSFAQTSKEKSTKKHSLLT